jgi:hypothetical protein
MLQLMHVLQNGQVATLVQTGSKFAFKCGPSTIHYDDVRDALEDFVGVVAYDVQVLYSAI